MNFTGKVAIITGAASGMGKLCATELAKRGAKVMLFDINPDTLDAACKEIEADGGIAAGYALDIRDYEAIKTTVAEINEKYGAPYLLINMAGGAETRMCKTPGAFWEVPISTYDWGIDVNLKAQLYCAHATMPYMVEQKAGVIINIGSITGYEGCASNVAYSASKSAAANGLTKSIAAAGAKHGIRCCCVSPGPVLTRANMATMKTAMGRAAEPIEIVNTILFVASDECSFATGVDFLIDGGRNSLARW